MWRRLQKQWRRRKTLAGVGVRAANPSILMTLLSRVSRWGATTQLSFNSEACMYLASQIALEIAELLMLEEPHLLCLDLALLNCHSVFDFSLVVFGSAFEGLHCYDVFV